jgi:hypothetical protein
MSSQARLLLLALPLLVIGPAHPQASSETSAEGGPTSEAGPELKTLEFYLAGFRIREKHLSMEGPQKKLPIKSALPKGSKVWVKSMAVEVLDGEREPISNEFLCHASLAYNTPTSRGMLTVSQGTEAVTLPEGFAFTMPNTADTKVALMGMLENNNHDVIDQRAVMKYTIGYYSDEDARSFAIKELEDFDMIGRPNAHAAHPKMEVPKGLHSHHWMVPPGRHTYRSALVRPLYRTPGNPLGIEEGTRIHFMRPHLHGYGESVALLDKTTGETLWTGYAKNAQDSRHLVAADIYSDVEGIRLHPDHEYELEVVYDNPTTEPIDAMGAIRALASTAIE